MKPFAIIYPVVLFLNVYSGAYSADSNKQSIPSYTMRKNCESVVTIHAYRTKNGKINENIGTGFIASSHGFIITGSSIVSNSDSVIITFYDGVRKKAWKSFFNEHKKIAILYTNRKSLKPVSYSDYNGLPESRTAFILGNSLGIFPSLSMFTIHGFNRFKNMFMIEGLILPGNSGSPVFDHSGKLIGMVLGTFYNKEVNDIPFRKMGFAIYADQLEQLLNNFVRQMEKNRHWAGISVTNILNDSVNNGVIVIDTAPEGPVDKAGIAQGDTLIEFEGKQIHDTGHLAEMVQNSHKEKVVFTVKKGSMKITRIVRMEKLPWGKEEKK